MTGPILSTGAAAGVVGGLVGGAVNPVAGVAAGVLVGVLGALAADAHQRRRVDRLAAQVEGWLVPGPAASSVVVADGDTPWRRLGAALNRLGEAFDHLREQVVRGGPWRGDLVHSLAAPALLFDDAGLLVACNPAAGEMLGLDDTVGPRTVVQVLGSAVLADAVGRARQVEGNVEVEASVGDRLVHASIAAIGDETLLVLTDRTEERRLEELRRNFVVNASHELKTPATAIHTLAEALEITAVRDPGRVPDLVARLREESERLVRLVHDLLDLRRLEEGVDLVDAVEVDLAALVRDVAAELGDRAAAHHVEVRLDVPEGAPLRGAPQDLRLVVRNLVANAIQYNREGGRVDVRVVPEADGWQLQVTDTGIGIPQQDVQRIFERFVRVDVARSRETGGTGLGLSIVRHAVERHGGSIRVDSLLGQGSTFTVTLPGRTP